MTRIDLYPNPAFVEAVRKDGYKEYSSDVFDTEDKTSKYYFIQETLIITDYGLEDLQVEKSNQSDYYNKYSNTIDYLLNYYGYLISQNFIVRVDPLGAKYGRGFTDDYIKAVNSKDSVLFSNTDEKSYGNNVKELGKWSEKMSSWFHNPEIIPYYSDFALMAPIGGYKTALGDWFYNIILVSSERNKGFEYHSQKMFMNWNGNPLNNKTD